MKINRRTFKWILRRFNGFIKISNEIVLVLQENINNPHFLVEIFGKDLLAITQEILFVIFSCFDTVFLFRILLIFLESKRQNDNPFNQSQNILLLD